ncbi:hypothetical protein HU200_016975 [Digitaria exilis]|uniref:Uncharacterized protein n=1 Tax=Digitaria exilis TaxID=1010633 RepID=A0A835KJB9_9POAL|nr:hypothetical protein HU200_016975 [Digitaria exilis]
MRSTQILLSSCDGETGQVVDPLGTPKGHLGLSATPQSLQVSKLTLPINCIVFAEGHPHQEKSHTAVVLCSQPHQHYIHLLSSVFGVTIQVARMKLGSQTRGGITKALKEHRSRLYIISRCVVMLIRWHD